MVMVDLNSFYSEMERKNARGRYASLSAPSVPRQAPELMDKSDQREFISDCLCRTCKNGKSVKANKTPPFEYYDKITRTSFQNLTDHQYLLCPKQIYVFVFQTRTWGK
jgi:hypothetical protein